MKNSFKRLLVAMLALVLLGSVMVPAAMAAEETTLVPKGSSGVEVYVGNRTTLRVYRHGVAKNPSLYKWTTSNPSVVTVNSKGVIIGWKIGSATITATHRGNGGKNRVTVRVKRNKADYINPKPAVSAAPYKSAKLALKSVEIVTRTQVDVEYYLPINFPSNWKAVAATEVTDAINLFNPSTGSYVKTIVGDKYQVKSTRITGFQVRYGGFVQVIKVTYSGNQVNCADVKLSKYRIRSSNNAQARIRYYH